MSGTDPRRPAEEPFIERGPLWGWTPPLIAFLAVNLVLATAGWADGFDPLGTEAWIRWDSLHYLEMARQGVTYEPCTITSPLDIASLFDTALDFFGFEVDHRDACGNAGWFPGYGLLIRAVAVSGLSHVVAAVLISTTLQAATLVLLWRWFLARHERASALLSLVAAAFFFGHVYYRGAFPLSLVSFLVLIHLHFVLRERWLAAGLAGAVAAFSYPTVYLAGAATALVLLFQRERPIAQRLRSVGIASGLTFAGFAAVLLYQRIETGVWGAFFNVQAQFDYHLRLPTGRLWQEIEPLVDNGIDLGTVPNLDTVLVSVTVIVLSCVAFRHRNDLTPAETWAVTFAVPVWFFPLLLGGRSSLYRIWAVALPVVLLLPRAPRWFQIGTATVTVGLSYPMALLFFRNVLI